jgi:ABC-type lipoprotein release transport system permease subunit
MSTLVFGMAAVDLPTLAGFVLLLLAVATVASCLPVIRATKTGPMEALR